MMPPLQTKWKHRLMRTSLVLLAFALLAGCGNFGFPGVYRINVEQGNIITQEMVDQLKPGMSRRQVRFILGTPLVNDTFNQDRWDYAYVLRNGTKVIEQSTLTVYFEGDELIRVEGDLAPADPGQRVASETQPESA